MLKTGHTHTRFVNQAQVRPRLMSEIVHLWTLNCFPIFVRPSPFLRRISICLTFFSVNLFLQVSPR